MARDTGHDGHINLLYIDAAGKELRRITRADLVRGFFWVPIASLVEARTAQAHTDAGQAMLIGEDSA